MRVARESGGPLAPARHEPARRYSLPHPQAKGHCTMSGGGGNWGASASTPCWRPPERFPRAKTCSAAATNAEGPIQSFQPSCGLQTPERAIWRCDPIPPQIRAEAKQGSGAFENIPLDRMTSCCCAGVWLLRKANRMPYPPPPPPPPPPLLLFLFRRLAQQAASSGRLQRGWQNDG